MTARKPLWARLLLGFLTGGIAVVVTVHLAMTFLISAPPNVISQRYARQVNAWIYPWFDQDWRLFAPNPLAENLRIQARAATGCEQQVSPWYDLTAMDDADIVHNPFPGHGEQNELRRAWLDGYLPSHDADDRPLNDRADMMRTYLVNIVRQRIMPLTAKDGMATSTISGLQIRVTTQALADAATPDKPPAADIRDLAWQSLDAGFTADCAQSGPQR